MTKFDTPGSSLEHGIVRKKWTDLRDSSRNDALPSFRPWLTPNKSKSNPIFFDEYNEYYISRKQCEIIINKYKKISDNEQNIEEKSNIEYFC
ncbi:hypothetical protein [Sphingobium sp.]|uniref:hypothetical protein n=1 Tax=Sphingobium sp. TaxID=1912891 RepID=UPI0028BF2551|nr:hypothetical protein [Sphingobium sp.]